ncbi:hypothetical protein ACJMK2_013169 [Sinanodonta woodiana]|uniref:Uncharacterized protein n=1 Tax=Sinanodonta woodiana TaxID=1069815 RepID=A0ABD3V005_SINWO
MDIRASYTVFQTYVDDNKCLYTSFGHFGSFISVAIYGIVSHDTMADQPTITILHRLLPRFENSVIWILSSFSDEAYFYLQANSLHLHARSRGGSYHRLHDDLHHF